MPGRIKVLRERGIETADGLPSPFISEYRQLMLAQAKFLQVMMEVADSASGRSRPIELTEAEADEILLAAGAKSGSGADDKPAVAQSVTEMSPPENDR